MKEQLRHRIAVLRMLIRQASAASQWPKMYELCREHDDTMLALWKMR